MQLSPGIRHRTTTTTTTTITTRKTTDRKVMKSKETVRTALEGYGTVLPSSECLGGH